MCCDVLCCAQFRYVLHRSVLICAVVMNALLYASYCVLCVVCGWVYFACCASLCVALRALRCASCDWYLAFCALHFTAYATYLHFMPGFLCCVVCAHALYFVICNW